MHDWDARLYREHTGFVSDLGLPVVDLLAPRSRERILDIGCGDGALTEHLVNAGCTVVGIDASGDMVEAARKLGIDARLMNAVDLEIAGWDGVFDAVFSNAALHWMHPLEAVLRGIGRVLKPGGRFVAELGGRGNVDNIRAALHAALRNQGVDPAEIDPWWFPSSQELTGLLSANGLEADFVDSFDRPTELPTGIVNWLESVARPFLEAVPPEQRQQFLAEVEAALEPVLRGDDGTWRADYVRLRVRAFKERSG